MNTETKSTTELESAIDTAIDAAKEAMRNLHALLAPLSRFKDGPYCAVSVEALGGEHVNFETKAFLGDGLHICSDSGRTILKAIREHGPDEAKQYKIEQLRRKLAEFEGK